MKSFLKKQNLNLESLENRTVPAVYDFVFGGGATGDDWSVLTNWKIDGVAATALPGPDDTVVLDGNDDVQFEVPNDVTIKVLEIKGENAILRMGHPWSTSKRLIVTDGSSFDEGTVDFSKGANDPLSSSIVLKGNNNFAGTSFTGTYANPNDIGRVTLSGGSYSAMLNDPMTFNIKLNIGDFNGGTDSARFDVFDNIDLSTHGMIQVYTNGYLDVKESKISSDATNNRKIFNDGIIKVHSTNTKSSEIKPEIESGPGGKFIKEGNGEVKLGGMVFKSGSKMYAWSGGTLDMLTVAEGGSGNSLVFDAGSEFHFLPSGNNTLTIDGGVTMNGESYFYSNVYNTPTGVNVNLSSLKTSAFANATLNVVSDSWSSANWTQNGSMNFDIFYDQPTATVFNSKITVEDNFYGNGALNVTTDYNGTAVDTTAIAHLVEGGNLVDNFLSTNFMGPYVGWIKSFSSSAFDLLGDGTGGGIIPDPVEEGLPG